MFFCFYPVADASVLFDRYSAGLWSGFQGGCHLKALICCINAKYVHASLAPWCLKAGVSTFCQTQVDCDVFESTINRPDAETLSQILSRRPDVLAFCCYIWNMETVGRLAAAVRAALTGVYIALGGPEVSFTPEDTLREHPEADAVISGEGERPFACLLDALGNGQSPAGIPGICLRTPAGPVAAPPGPPEPVPPSPYCGAWFERLGGRIAYLETSRGCPFSCAFCLSGQKGGVRFYPMARVQHELLELAASGARVIKLVDRTFNCDPARAYEIFAFLIGQYGSGIPAGTRFHFEVGADLFDARTLALLRTAPQGLFQLEAGIQSFSDETLEAVRRKTDMARLYDNLAALIGGGKLIVHIDLIAGLPLEDLDGFGRSFDRAFSLRPQMLQLGFLKLLRGSLLRRQALADPSLGYRFSSRPPYEVSETRWLSLGNLVVLHGAEDALERLYNSGRFRGTLEYVLAASGLRPFELFCRFGAEKGRLLGEAPVPLDVYTGTAFRFFASLPGVNARRLRDEMALDRLGSDNTGRLPPCLRVFDPRLKTLARRFGPHRCAILYAGTEHAAIADYAARHPVTGRYPLRVLPLSKALGGSA